MDMVRRIGSVRPGTHVGMIMDGETYSWIAKPSCGNDRVGFMLCLTHEVVLMGGMEDAHLLDDEFHELGWICEEHGLEEEPEAQGVD